MSISYTHEIQRKLIHLSSLWMPAVIALLPQHDATALFAVLSALMLLGEFLRMRVPACGTLYNRLLGRLLRAHENGTESRSFTGATYVVLAAFLCVWLFPRWTAVTSLAVMLVADAAASLVGRRWGRRTFAGKTLEGSLAFAGAGLITITAIGLMAGLNADFYGSATAAVATALVAELFARRIRLDDNLLVPLVAGFTMLLLGGNS